MGAATRQFDSLNGSAAAQARLTGASIHRSLPSVIAIDTLQVTEIAEGCATNADADLQYVHQAFADLLKLFAVEPACWRLGCNARCKQALIGIDISRASHE